MKNLDQEEVKKFNDIAEKWWDETGDFKPLHQKIGEKIPKQKAGQVYQKCIGLQESIDRLPTEKIVFNPSIGCSFDSFD